MFGDLVGVPGDQTAARIAQAGAEAASELDGSFGAVFVQRPTGRVSLLTDSIGARALRPSGSRWCRTPSQRTLLLDVAHREFTFFSFTFYPTDAFLLLLFGITALVSIALLRALLGRVWCGWSCPQTVYLEFVYRPSGSSRGKEHVRKRCDGGPWTLDKASPALGWRRSGRSCSCSSSP